MTPTCKSARVRNLRRLNLDFADALRRRLEPARCPRWPCGSRFAISPTYATQSSTSRRRSRRRGALLRRFPLRGLPLGGLARRLLRRGLRLRLCLLRHSALLANDDETGDATQKGNRSVRRANLYSTTNKIPNPGPCAKRRASGRQALCACASPIDRHHRKRCVALCNKLHAFAETSMGQGLLTFASNLSAARKAISRALRRRAHDAFRGATIGELLC